LGPYFTNGLNKLEGFVPGKPFQPNVMFAGKARSLPKLDYSDTHKHDAFLEIFPRDKHCSLFGRYINYGRKKFYNIGTRGRSGKKLGITNMVRVAKWFNQY
jgi:hypothetical protein